VRHQLERGRSWCLTLSHQHSDVGMWRWAKNCESPWRRARNNSKGPRAARNSPRPHGYPKSYCKGASLAVLLWQQVQNYLMIHWRWRHGRKGGSLGVPPPEQRCHSPPRHLRSNPSISGVSKLRAPAAWEACAVFRAWQEPCHSLAESIRSNRKSQDSSRDSSCHRNTDCGDQLLSYSQGMNDKSQRVAGMFIAPLIMLAGLWLCLDGLEHGGLSGIFSIGPFVALAGALWFVSDWF
jgi:hypothetical protein